LFFPGFDFVSSWGGLTISEDGGFDEVADMMLTSESNDTHKEDIAQLTTLLQVYGSLEGDQSNAAREALAKLSKESKGTLAQAAQAALEQPDVVAAAKAYVDKQPLDREMEKKLVESLIDRFDEAGEMDTVASMVLASEKNADHQTYVTNIITLLQVYGSKVGKQGIEARNALMKIGGMAHNEQVASQAIDAHKRAEMAAIERAAA